MRIKTIEDLEGNLKTKVFYLTEIPDALENSRVPIKGVQDLRRLCRVYPYTLEKRVNEDLAGYRIDENGVGQSFECKGSVVYEFKPILSAKAGKKLKVDTAYFNGSEGASIFKYETVDVGWKGISTYTDLTIWNGERETYYVENSIVSPGEYEGDPDGVVFTDTVKVFTEAYEAYRHVVSAAGRLVGAAIENINKRAELDKSFFYDLKYRIEHGSL